MDGIWCSIYKPHELLDQIDTEWLVHELPDDDIVIPPASSLNDIQNDDSATPLNPTNVSHAVLNNTKLNQSHINHSTT